jgi:hypothetical protein
MAGRSRFAVTRSLERAKQRYPWARAWVQLRRVSGASSSRRMLAPMSRIRTGLSYSSHPG